MDGVKFAVCAPLGQHTRISSDSVWPITGADGLPAYVDAPKGGMTRAEYERRQREKRA